MTWTSKLLFVVLFLDICALVGCHRGYYRRQADREAKCLIDQKATDPRWNSITGSVELDPYSRMFNPFSNDHPPIPTDDPTSNQLMQCVDGKRGYPHWNANGKTDFVENPEWKAYLPVNETGKVVLTLDRAFQLALLHSPDYQAQLETVYLSALDVSLERFGFDTQMFAGFNSFVQRRGRAQTGSGTSSTQIINNLGANSEGIGLRRFGITGANYVVGLANTILFNVSGSSSRSANSLLDFSVIQPLLRGAGRDRILENLTQTERTLLANIRQMERYRRGFFLQVATGRSPGAGPNRTGNFLFQPAGATTFAGGFYGVLIQETQIRNQEFNIRQLQSVLEQFRELYSVGRLDALQLRQFESSVFDQQNALVIARIRYQATLDQFKVSLGLPPDLEVVVQDSSLDQFKLISDEVNNRLIGISDLRRRAGLQLTSVVDQMPQREVDVEAANFGWNDVLSKRIAELTLFLDEAQKMLAQIEVQDIETVRRDLVRLESVRADRVAYLERLQGSGDAEDIVSVLDASLYSPDSIPTKESLLELLEGESVDSVTSTLARLRELNLEIELTKQQIADLNEQQANFNQVELFRFIKENIQEAIPEQLAALNNISLELTLLQARARSNSIEMIDVNIDAETAIEMARCFRRDWMNARASLVDNWRQIEFVADQLESQFDLVFQAEMGTVGSNPLQFRDSNGQLRAGFRFDTPIVRMIERNQYRETLIRYSQARRQFYQFEDEIKRNLRDIVRNLNRNKVLFELNRRAIQIQIEAIELARLNLDAPQPIPAADALGGGGRTSQLGDVAARNLSDAINSLNRIQNDFVGSWVEYEVLRRGLDFDMGTMQLDETGAWIDPGLIDNSIGLRAAQAMGIELDCDFCSDAVLFPQMETTKQPGTQTQPLPGAFNFSDQGLTPVPAPDSNPPAMRRPDDLNLPPIPNAESLPPEVD